LLSKLRQLRHLKLLKAEMKVKVMKIKYETLSELRRQIEELNKSFLALTRAHYQLISSLIPEAKPTKKEKEILKKRKNEPVVSLEALKRKLR